MPVGFMGLTMKCEPADEIHVAVVDDDPRIRSMLKTYLEGERFRVTTLESAARLRQIDLEDVDLLMLDVGLPGEDGLTVAQAIRARRNTPIIMISGRGHEVDRVLGLEIGADDYITKPFSLREVLARIRSILRRTRPAIHMQAGRDAEAEAEASAHFDGWRLDPQKRELLCPEGAEVLLTTGEFDLLLAFASHPRRVLGRDTLMDLTRGRNWEAFDRAIDAQVTRLRRKIERDPSHPTLIKSVRSHGYIFTPKVEWL